MVERVGHKDERPAVPASMPAEIADIVRGCWRRDPTSRPVMTDVVARIQKAAGEVAIPVAIPLVGKAPIHAPVNANATSPASYGLSHADLSSRPSAVWSTNVN